MNTDVNVYTAAKKEDQEACTIIAETIPSKALRRGNDYD